MSRGTVRSIPFFITGPFLAILLIINMTVIVGAFTLKAETESIRLWLAQQLDGVYGTADVQSSQQIGDLLNEEFPLSECFLNLFDFSGHPIDELPQVFYEVINEEMTSVIWNKLLWSLGFIVAAVLIALYFDKGEGNGLEKKSKRPQTVSRKNYDNF